MIGHVRARPIVAALVTLALVGCGGDGGTPTPVDGGLVGATAEVHVYDAWVPPTRAATAEVSMRLHNGGPQDDRLLDAACACEGTVAVDGAVVLAPEEEVVLAPGGTPGLRLTGLTEDLRRGGFVSLTLTFEHAGTVTAQVEVRGAGD